MMDLALNEAGTLTNARIFCFLDTPQPEKRKNRNRSGETNGYHVGKKEKQIEK